MRVGLFVTCLVDLMRPSIGLAALKLLWHAGCGVMVPQTQTCCGQPAYNSGDRASALALARKVMGEFESCDYVVAPSGSCAGMIRTHFPDLFSGEPAERERVGRFCAKTYELTDFLCNVAGCRRFGAVCAATVTYHDSCAGLRELGIKAQPRALLREIDGLTLKEMEEPEACCGFGGTFAVKFGAIATKLADDKCRQAQATSADAIVLGDLGCMLHIEGRLRRCGDSKTRVLHVAEVLAGES
jgi:L-lactate dehydrogenase complex protein LldE